MSIILCTMASGTAGSHLQSRLLVPGSLCCQPIRAERLPLQILEGEVLQGSSHFPQACLLYRRSLFLSCRVPEAPGPFPQHPVLCRLTAVLLHWQTTLAAEDRASTSFQEKKLSPHTASLWAPFFRCQKRNILLSGY